MRRFFITLSLTLTLFVGAAAPAYAANLPLFDSNFTIVPSQCTACPCGFGGILQLVQNLINAGVSLGVVAMIFVIAYAGASFMLNPTNPETRTKARSMLINVVVGMVVLLSAWLVVDFIMKTLYNDGAQYGPWNSILAPIAGDTSCIQATTPHAISGILGSIANGTFNGSQTGNGGTGGTGGGVPSGPPAPATRGICTPTGLGQYGWPSNLTTKMSCVTRFENGSCNASAPSGTDIGRDGNSVSIGLFQVNISANNLNTPACEQFNSGQPLNCTQAFGGGAYTASNHQTFVTNQRLYQVCRAAASNPSCNTSEAINIYNKQGIKAWGTAAQNNCSGL
jgi:hypothetical protein